MSDVKTEDSEDVRNAGVEMKPKCTKRKLENEQKNDEKKARWSCSNDPDLTDTDAASKQSLGNKMISAASREVRPSHRKFETSLLEDDNVVGEQGLHKVDSTPSLLESKKDDDVMVADDSMRPGAENEQIDNESRSSDPGSEDQPQDPPSLSGNPIQGSKESPHKDDWVVKNIELRKRRPDKGDPSTVSSFMVTKGDDNVMIVKNDSNLSADGDVKEIRSKKLLEKLTHTHNDQANLIVRLRESVKHEEAKLALLRRMRQSQLLKQQRSTTRASTNRRSRVLVTGVQNFMTPNQSAHISSSMSSLQAPQFFCPRNTVGRDPQVLQRHKALNMPQHRKLEQLKSPAVTLKQQHDSAKLSLRKRLEKTLLEIPTPNPPLPEISLLPNPASYEFLYLFGLEQVGKNFLRLQPGQPRDEIKPYVCVRCTRDFSPVWRSLQSTPDKVMCQKCVNTIQKKVLKEEHTTQLKTAFVRAVQQEHNMNNQSLSEGSQTGIQKLKQRPTSTHIPIASQLTQANCPNQSENRTSATMQQPMLARVKPNIPPTSVFRPSDLSRVSFTSVPFARTFW